MRGRKQKTWDDWDLSNLNRRDFRQDHGGGPEAPRHRKKAKPKPTFKHEHEWLFKADYGIFQIYYCRLCNKKNYSDIMF